jgi:hypothetical protein
MFDCAVKWLNGEKNQNKYHTVETVPKSKREIVERDKIDTPNIQIHGRSIYWIGIETSIKRGGVKLLYWPKPSRMYFVN